MPTLKEIRNMNIGKQYKEPIKEIPPGTTQYGVLPIVYGDHFIVFCRVLELGKEEEGKSW